MVTPCGDIDFSKLVNLCLVKTFSFISTSVAQLNLYSTILNIGKHIRIHKSILVIIIIFLYYYFFAFCFESKDSLTLFEV